MTCANYNFSACSGGTFVQPLVYKDSLGVPIDISAFTATWVLGPNTYISPSQQVTVGPEPGTVHLLLTSTEVGLLEPVTKYRITLTDLLLPAGQGDIPLLEGRLEIE